MSALIRSPVARGRRPVSSSSKPSGTRGSPVGPRACAGASRARRDAVGVGRRPPLRAPRPRPRTRRPRRASGSGTRASPRPRRSQRIAEPRVDDEPSLDHAEIELRVVDHERRRSSRRSARRAGGEHVPVVRRRRTVDVLLEGGSLQVRLVRGLLLRPQREVEDLHREPAAERGERAADERVVPSRQPDLGMPPVDHLPDRLVEGRRVVDRRERREAHGHPLREWPVARAGHEDAEERETVPYRSGTAASTSRSDSPRGHQNSSASELITQSAPKLCRRESRHARHPFVLAQVLARLADEVDVPFARVALEHLGGAVAASGCRSRPRSPRRRSGGSRAMGRRCPPRRGRGAS